MPNCNRRAVLAGIVGGTGGAGIGGCSWNRYVDRNDLRLNPVRLTNSNTDPQEIHVRIYDDDDFEYAATHTLEASREEVGYEDSSTSRTLDGPWTKTPREYGLVATHDDTEWDLSNADIWSEMEADDPESECAHITASIAGIRGDGSLSVHVSASDSC